jgi:hypothetical protein
VSKSHTLTNLMRSDVYVDESGAFTAPMGVSRTMVSSSMLGAYMMPEEPVSIVADYYVLRKYILCTHYFIHVILSGTNKNTHLTHSIKC